MVRLAKAFAMLPAMVRQEHPLILAGGSGWYSGKIRDEIDQLHLGDRIRSLGYVEDQALPSLYTLASVFVYPSLYEGFGFPPLEAMACGTPVICSRASSLPEVVGDAGVLVDPTDVKEIATQLERLLTDGAARRSFSQAGLERAKRFDPCEQARKVLGVFEELVATKAH